LRNGVGSKRRMRAVLRRDLVRARLERPTSLVDAYRAARNVFTNAPKHISTIATTACVLVFRNAAYFNGPLTIGCLNQTSNFEANK
jgi:hypothetical protein